MFQLVGDTIDLYRPEKTQYLKSLEYAKTLPPSSNPILVFHCFWRVPRPFGRKQAAMLKSVLVHHVNHLDHLEINLWSNVDLSKDPLLESIAPWIRFRLWDYEVEKEGSLLEYCSIITKKTLDDSMYYLESDLFRLLVLHKYGGFYLDMDVLVLRSMAPLNDMEFAYQWGTSGTNPSEPILKANNAVIRLHKGSPLSAELIELLLRNVPIKDTTCWGSDLYSKLNNNSMVCLPGVWFDSEWCVEGARLNPFDPCDSIQLYEGAFTWHWHNQWDAEIHERSKFQYIEQVHEDVIRTLTSNKSECRFV